MITNQKQVYVTQWEKEQQTKDVVDAFSLFDRMEGE